MTATDLRIELPAEVVQSLVEQIAERVRTEVEAASPWMDRPAAASYMGLPVSNVEKNKTIPVHRVGARCLYKREELDEWLLSR